MRVTWILSALLTAAACTSSVEPQASEALSAVPTTGSAAGGDLPPGCKPIDLRAPTGERIDLNGVWTEIGTVGGNPMTWWIRTEGDCVWGAGSVEEVPPQGDAVRPGDVQSLAGRMGSDFVITGEIISLGLLPFGAPRDPPRYATVEVEIVFDDAGNITLHENRDPGVTGPRCPDPAGYCPAPLVLQPID
jgi:hypothetical protein